MYEKDSVFEDRTGQRGAKERAVAARPLDTKGMLSAFKTSIENIAAKKNTAIIRVRSPLTTPFSESQPHTYFAVPQRTVKLLHVVAGSHVRAVMETPNAFRIFTSKLSAAISSYTAMRLEGSTFLPVIGSYCTL